MAAVSSLPLVESRTRVTKEGRTLTYNLSVIQQPERARACGSGAKSSADRRPVDPPPVVELRIFEGEGNAKQDITFSYNANFFLYTDLELARPILNGRVQCATAQTCPVLTGCPVSGMAYLDRPSEAGYFIFPDLSVRHEGMYKLCFSLYEETKEPKDEDLPKDANSAEEYPDGSFDWRLEIKSAPFTVFSAKKFPGLAESTMLSRTVAEQGCRVRIRRDVRMRRRDAKAADYEDDEYIRARKSCTPESIHDVETRQRSLSASSQDRQQYPPDYPQRRTSGEYHTAPYYGQSQHAPPGGYLAFAASSAQQYQAPQFAQPQLQPPSHSQQYATQSAFNQGQQYRQQQAPPNNYAYQERQPYPSYGPARDYYEPDHRRASVGFAPAPPPSSQYAMDQGYNRAQSMSYPPQPHRAHTPMMQPTHLPPLKMAPLEVKHEGLSSPLGPMSTVRTMAPPLPSPSYQERSNSYSHFPPPSSLSADPPRSAKRPFDSVFNSSNFNQPLHNGMRPADAHTQSLSSTYDDDEDTLSLEAFKMQYKRADGTPYSRELPSLQ